MAGAFKNLRSTSESHVFQQVLRQDKSLARAAARDRDPMALSAARAGDLGVTSVAMMSAVLNGYNPGRPFVDPVVPFFPTFVSITPDEGTANGGTPVIAEVTSSRYMTGLRVGGSFCTDFAIIDATHVSGVTAVGSTGLADVLLENVFGQTLTSDAFFYLPVTFIYTVAPNTGADGVESPVVSGVGFTGTTTVTLIDQTSFTEYSQSFTVDNDGQITIINASSGGASGMFSLRVVSPTGSATMADAYLIT